MEQNAPAPSPTTSSAQTTCQWCSKPMDASLVRCTNCGKLRKDIYNDKIKSYIFCILGGLGIGFSFKFFGGHSNNNYDFNNFNGGAGNSSDNTTGIILLIVGIILGAVGTYFYVKVSKQLKAWWWT